jgi:hypothetical protein
MRTLTIRLPDEVYVRLQHAARGNEKQVGQVAVRMLSAALPPDDTLLASWQSGRPSQSISIANPVLVDVETLLQEQGLAIVAPFFAVASDGRP